MRLRSLLRGSCFGTVVPWGLASFYRVCGGGAGLGLPGPAHLGGSLLQSWCLGLGPGCLVCRLPSVSFPWVGSTVGFLGSVSTPWESLVPYSVAFDSFSSSSSLHLSARALPEERVGVAGLGLHPPASVPPDPATRLSGWPHWVTIPPKLQSAFYSAGKYSVGTNGVLRKLKHIFPNTYQRINMMARLPPR